MTKAVLFDFTQTLVDSVDGFHAAEKQAEVRLSAALDLSSWEEFLAEYRELRARFQDAAPNFPRPDLWREVYARHGREPDDNILAEWELAYWDAVTAGTVLFPETIRTLTWLTDSFSLALVTNHQGPGDHTLSHFPTLQSFFDVIVVAGEGSVPAKPDPAPFLQCLERLGVAASDAVHVGDDWRVDVCGARNAGIRPIWIKHRSVQRNWPEGEPAVPVIEKLDDLLDPARTLLRDEPPA